LTSKQRKKIEYISVKRELFVNADLIADGLSPFDPSGVAIRAGRLMLRD
jgi:predicted ABC-type ATPase